MLPELECLPEILSEMKKMNQFLEKIEEHLRVPDLIELAKTKSSLK